MQKSIFLSLCCLILVLTTAASAQPPSDVWQVQAYISQVNALAYSSNGQTIATGSGLMNEPIKFWATEDGSLQQSFELNSSSVLSVNLSSDGQYLAAGYIISGYPPGSLTQVWNIPGQTIINEFGGAYASFSPDAARIATGGGSVNRYLSVHDIATGNQIFHVYTGDYISEVVYSPDGLEIATGGADHNVKLWDAENGTLIHTLTGHTDDLSAVAYSHDGSLLASGEGGFDGGGQAYVKLWEVSSGILLRTLTGFGDWVYDLDFSPDDQYLLSSGRESTTPLVQKIKIWRVSDGQGMIEYDDSAWCLSYSPDGQYFAYGSPYGDLFLAENPLAAYNVSVTLTPLNPPIIIPANGGSFNFNASALRSVGPQAPFSVWARIKNPDGTYTNPTIGPININPPVGITVTRQRTQTVPGSWAAGTYTYLGYGSTSYAYPAIDSSSFTFTKSSTADGGPFIMEATCYGEPFPGEVISRAGQALPLQMGIVNISPNPFNPTTTISYQIPDASPVRLKVYDTAGRLVATLADGFREAGTHEVTFEGSKLASGVYLYRLDTGVNSAVGKIMLMK